METLMGLFGDKNKKTTGRAPGHNASPKGFVSSPPVKPPTASIAPKIVEKEQITEDQAFYADLDLKIKEANGDKAREDYIHQFYLRKKLLEDVNLSPDMHSKGNHGALYIIAKGLPGGNGRPATEEVTTLLDFATVSKDNPDYNTDSLLNRIQPKKITNVKDYAITLYGDFLDTIPEETGACMFKEIGTFMNVKVGKNLDTGEYGLIVSQKYDDVLNRPGNGKDKERFIPNREISIVGYEV